MFLSYLLLSTSLIFVLARSSHFWSSDSFRQNLSNCSSKVKDIEEKLLVKTETIFELQLICFYLLFQFIFFTIFAIYQHLKKILI